MPSYEDTISSANTYYNNQYRNDPGVIQGYAKIYKREIKDTLETKQQRLERHLETRFQMNQQTSSGKVVLIAQVGKYAILAFVMPPYYLFYEGPKWILIMIQPLFLISFEKAGNFLLLICTFSIDFWAGLGKKLHFFKKAKYFLKEKTTKINQTLSQEIKKLTKLIIPLFQPVTHFIQTMRHYSKTYKEWKVSAKLWFKTLPFKLKKKFESKTRELIPSLKLKALKALKTFFNPIKISYNKTIQFISPAFQLFKPIFKTIDKVLNTSQKWVKKFFTELNRVKRGVIHGLKKNFRLALKPLDIVKNSSKKAIDTAKSEILKVKNACMKWSQAILTASLVQIQRISIPLKEGSLNLMQKVKVVIKQVKYIQSRVKQILGSLLKKGEEQAKKGFTKLQKIASAAIQAMAKSSSWVYSKLEKFPSLFFLIWQKIQAFISKLAKQTVWSLLVALAWSKIFIRYSLSSLWD